LVQIKDDPNFLGISVASEVSLLNSISFDRHIMFVNQVSRQKWMPMKEVPETDVLTFLKEKKQEGYVICGLEQTTNSTPLQDFDFPAKCVLLLGMSYK
jgi:tRNA G18 (ribose-2'-O)-methylase SpoU